MKSHFRNLTKHKGSKLICRFLSPSPCPMRWTIWSVKTLLEERLLKCEAGLMKWGPRGQRLMQVRVLNGGFPSVPGVGSGAKIARTSLLYYYCQLFPLFCIRDMM